MELLPYWDKQFHRVYSSDDWIEYTDAGVNKGVGLEKLYKTFGVLPSEIVAIGDSGNDIYMSGYQVYALLLTLSSIGVPNAISKLVSEKLALRRSKRGRSNF